MKVYARNAGLWLPLFGLALAGLLSGCSAKVGPSSPVAQNAGGLHIQFATDPNPPRVGDNTLIVTLTDSKTNAPVVNANVTGAAYNKVAGGGDQETGRSQGNGVYNVPIKLPTPDQYTANITVEQIGKPDVSAKFPLSAQ
ncbi:MAG TPA: FixH family protein [Capsulimonadaceae bacterium]|nr:FixH family protein [Capsulimonadaceae bacterium]